jgi:hypothetical protein
VKDLKRPVCIFEHCNTSAVYGMKPASDPGSEAIMVCVPHLANEINHLIDTGKAPLLLWRVFK